jgi:hypothetical protein
MPELLILPAGALLNVLPYALLCILPFRKYFKFPLPIVSAILIVPAVTEFSIYYFIQSMPYFVEQLVFFIFLAVYLLIYLFIIRIDILKLIFVFFIITNYAAVIVGISNHIEIHRFPSVSHFGGYSLQLILIHLIVFLITVPLYAYILIKLITPLMETENRAWKLLWIIPFMSFAATVIYSGSDSDHLINSWQYIMVTSTKAIVSYIVLLVIVEMLLKTDETAKLKDKYKKMEMLIDFQKREYEQINHRIAETKILRHDQLHHLAVVDGFLNSGDLIALKAYLDEYRKTFPQGGEEPVSENYTVNAILQHYAEIAQAESIRMRMNIQIPKVTGYSDVELCIVFGNCIENAIEACRAVSADKRYIRIKARMHGDVLGIVIDNGFDGKVKVVDGKFISKKRGNTEGMGLSSVTAIADKYNGKAIFTFNECEFQASVILNNKKMNEGAMKNASTYF